MSHPEFDAFKERVLRNPEARAAYEAAERHHRLTTRGERWLIRWRIAKHAIVWSVLILMCLGTLALFGFAIAAAFQQPHATP